MSDYIDWSSVKEDDIIYGKPTGNNASRGNSKLVRFRVGKVKRVWVELFTYYSDGTVSSWAEDYRKDTGGTKGQYGENSGYIFFKDEEVVNTYLSNLANRNTLSKFFSGYTLPKLTSSQVESILNIIGKEIV